MFSMGYGMCVKEEARVTGTVELPSSNTGNHYFYFYEKVFRNRIRYTCMKQKGDNSLANQVGRSEKLNPRQK